METISAEPTGSGQVTARFDYRGAPVEEVVVTFQGFADRFAFDNLTFQK